MERIILQIGAESLAELDRAAYETNMSRAAFIRAAVEAFLAERRRRRELQQVIDAYRASPPEDLTVPKEALRAVWPE